MRVRAALASAVAAAAVLLMLVGGGECAMYKVGDLDAWGIPPASKPDVYVRWPKSIHFALSDSIWFLYPPSQDSVLQVTARAFAACDLANPVLKLADGNSVFNLTTPGRVYYTSGAPGHCHKGQKLTIDVPMANGTHVPPSADDLAAIAHAAADEPPAEADGPAGALSDSAPSDAHHSPSSALRAVAGAGSVLAAAAVSFALLV
ncbi:hypothetical protein ACP70R_002395 [Stipagrostis hirtigluma subsp. patula]